MSGHIWRFADCEFDELRRDLRIGGRPVDVEVKPLDVLNQLLLHAGEVVTKDELLESVWPGTTVVDGSLATAVSKLRKASAPIRTSSSPSRASGIGWASRSHRQNVHRTGVARAAPHAGQTRCRDAINGVSSATLDLAPSSEVWLAEHPKTRELRVFKFALDAAHLKSLKREVTLGPAARANRSASGRTSCASSSGTSISTRISSKASSPDPNLVRVGRAAGRSGGDSAAASRRDARSTSPAPWPPRTASTSCTRI